MLHGREPELVRLVVLVEDARDGAAGSVLVRGEPGVGKSALLAVVVSDRVRDRLIEETGGNPLALVELPTGLSSAHLDGTEPLPPQLMLTTGVERVFLDRSRCLTGPAQTFMLVAAADDTGRLVAALARR
ncbi:hypothetical protein ABIB25_005324 [Nakamurella sp. UYEF19]|uniref:ATP-binding protein n=1 Tax=Nakamurella sp. UYEF19 TaxID=1756392 RepID=UPI003399977F